jgi:hypothetical protein
MTSLDRAAGASDDSRLHLIRIASVVLDPPLEEGISWQARIGETEVTAHRARSDQDETLRHLVTSRIALTTRPDVSSSENLIVPDEERTRAEAAIERVVDTIAVSRRALRSLSSPMPYLAIEHSTDADREWLRSLAGFELEPYLVSWQIPPPIDLGLMVTVTTDRPDGLELLAEAFAHRHPTGRYHEFLRFFERAFARKPRQLLAPMIAYFSGTPYGYTRAELREWLDTRGPSVHGYGQLAVLEAGVRPILPRIEQAAVDVLTNKVSWHDSSAERANKLAADVRDVVA